MAWMNSVNHRGKSGKGFVKPGTGGGSTVEWTNVPGIYIKIGTSQNASTSLFPFPYDSNAASTSSSVYGQLDRLTWLRGIQQEANWGEIDNDDPNPNNWNWTELDRKFRTIKALPRSTGQNKKIILLLTPKAFSNADVPKIIPPSLRTGTGTYGPVLPRYDHLIGMTGSGQDVYHLLFKNFRNGLTGNDAAGTPIYTLRDRYRAFITALYNRYGPNGADDVKGVLAGFNTVEPIPLTPQDAAEWNATIRDQHFEGRCRWLQWMKGVFTNHFLCEGSNFDNEWIASMLTTGPNDLNNIGNKIGFSSPNYHLGGNLTSIYTAADSLAGIVPVIQQMQGFDMDSKTGFRVNVNSTPPHNVYNWTPVRPGHGSPRTLITNPNVSGGVIVTTDPPDLPWAIERAIYLKSNIFIIQRDTATVGQNGSARYNWNLIVADMAANTTILSDNTGGLIQNDPYGGMIPTQPTYVV